MSRTSITKQALAESLKRLMAEMPFHKITISDISDGCGMSRKSFYYHFRDKYELVNWIFDTEFMAKAAGGTYNDLLGFFSYLCTYLEENRIFYRKAFQITGQNAFSDHFVEVILPIIERELEPIFGAEIDPFYKSFYSDALLMTTKRWILSKEMLPSQAFIEKIREVVVTSAIITIQKTTNDK